MGTSGLDCCRTVRTRNSRGPSRVAAFSGVGRTRCRCPCQPARQVPIRLSTRRATAVCRSTCHPSRPPVRRVVRNGASVLATLVTILGRLMPTTSGRARSCSGTPAGCIQLGKVGSGSRSGCHPHLWTWCDRWLQCWCGVRVSHRCFDYNAVLLPASRPLPCTFASRTKPPPPRPRPPLTTRSKRRCCSRPSTVPGTCCGTVWVSCTALRTVCLISRSGSSGAKARAYRGRCPTHWHPNTCPTTSWGA